jgi:hypothetical protein
LKRKVIIHKHLFKNAGTTFDWSLKENFGDAFYDHRDDLPMRKEGQIYLIDFLKKNPKILALSSHHVWFHFKADDEIELIPVYLLRHPVERIRSVYNFEHSQESDTLGPIMAKEMNFKEYVRWRMRDDVPPTVRNFQTRYLAGTKIAKPLNEQHLKSALEEIDNCNFIGIVDRYDDSMKIFEQEFRKLGISLSLTTNAQNMSQSIENINIGERVNSILSELEELGEIVVRNNQFDIDIYNYANEKLQHTLLKL